LHGFSRGEGEYWRHLTDPCSDQQQVIRDSINDLNLKASQQALPRHLSSELHTLVVLSTHRVAKARDIAFKYFNRLITSFPSLMCDPVLVFVILEVLTLLQRACENEYIDEVCDMLFKP
jgi:phosphatidylinositol 4-kinase A